jgi:hypothetical protein
VALAGPARAQQPYTFTRIADSTTANFHFFDNSPAVNATGTVVFRVSYTTAVGGIYTGSGGSLTTVASTSGPEGFTAFGTFGSPTINAAGDVAFLGQFSTTSALLVRGPTPFTVASSNNSPWANGTNVFNDGPAINGNNQVAFRGNQTSDSGVYRFNGNGAPTSTDTIASLNTSPQGFSQFLGDPAINAGGTVVFKANLAAGGSGIYLGTGSGSLTTIVTTGGTITGTGAWPSINTAGHVAYLVTGTGYSAVYRYAGGSSTLIADSTGVFSNIVTNPAISGADRVAFVADLAAGGRGLFTGGNPATDTVIQTGSALDGSTVTDLFVGPSAFNDAGQLAFYATLADGRSGVYLATPVPETAHLLLLGGAALALAGGLRRRSHASSGR